MTMSFYAPDREVAAPGEMLDHGWNYLRAAIDLGQLVAEEAARRADDILANSLEDRPSGRVIPTRYASELAGLLAEVVRAASSIMDDDYQVRPEAVAQVLSRLPGFVSSWDGSEGRVYSLANAIIAIEAVEDLLRRAGALGHEVDVA